jgi:tetratricopeptide (TPR) repeat protein
MTSGQTKPNRPKDPHGQGSGPTKASKVVARSSGGNSAPNPKKGWLNIVMAMVFFIGALMLLGAVSGWLGYQSGQENYNAQVTVTVDAYLASQFAQAIEDVNNENYQLAVVRLEYILSVKPDYKPAQDLLVDLNVILNVTSTPTAVPATPTPSATPDLRPAEEMYTSVLSLISVQSWNAALDTLANLRKTNPDYKIVEVDGLIFLCLRNRGVEKILNGDLEGGIYDFLLAEQFGPLDGETENYRNWARLYLLGNAFWGAYPEQAAYYYGQLVSAAPSITDASGVSSFYRYWASLLQMAENLTKEEKWCESSDGMVHVLGVWDQAYVYPTATYVYEQCLLGTPSVTPTPTITPTLSETYTPTDGVGGPTETPTPTSTATPGDPESTPTFTPSPTNTPNPGD